MEDAHTTSEESAGEYHFPDSSGSSEIGFPSQDVPFSNYAHEHLWSPVCLSSPSASTDYLSNNPTPFTTPLTRLADSLPDDGYSYEARSSLRYSSSDTSTATWCEQLSWSEPSPLEDCINRHFNDSTSDGCVIDDAVSSEPIPETPDEHVDSLPQDEVDKNTREMTCGPKVEEHFWPIRYRIRSGKFQNTINALIVHARKELQPAMHGRLSKLTTN
ncbi:hypothetical protein B0H13DRAFT_374956 [Mycena leptocephala]|nr:hypothetical protein B0H13DRAFT_374956 [Mycena leptocephala]